MMDRRKANLARFIRNLHENTFTVKQECKHYKMLYRNECFANSSLRKDVANLKKQLLKLNEQYQKICAERKKQEHDENQQLSCSKRKRKSWCRLKCNRTKRQRISEYGTYVLSQIKAKIPHCKRAQLSLSLGTSNVSYNWESQDLHESPPQKTPKFNFGSTADHSYASPKESPLDNEEYNESDIDYSSIFDAEGNWKSKHKRTIINVMDSFRISHEGYHELRQVAKGQFPPLHHIMKEKTMMSTEIPYTKHTSVRCSYILNDYFGSN